MRFYLKRKTTYDRNRIPQEQESDEVYEVNITFEIPADKNIQALESMINQIVKKYGGK